MGYPCGERELVDELRFHRWCGSSRGAPVERYRYTFIYRLSIYWLLNEIFRNLWEKVSKMQVFRCSEPLCYCLGNETVQTPTNPAVQRLKDAAENASNAIIANTPLRKQDVGVVNKATPGQSCDVTKRVDSAGSKERDVTVTNPDACVIKRTEPFVHPAEHQSRKRPVSPAADVTTDDQNVTAAGPSSKDVTPRNSIGNNSGFSTPANLKRVNHKSCNIILLICIFRRDISSILHDNFTWHFQLSSIGSAGKSPFHLDTPTSPYGQVFLDNGVEPSPATRKKWKRFIDNLPDLYEGSPEVQEFRKRRPSTVRTILERL